MSTPPTASRPPAPEVPPLEHAGVIYTQDETNERQGDQAGGYLSARDANTGKPLWRIKVYEVPDYRDEGISMGGVYFRSMRLLPGEDALEIESEVGGIYRVDLATRQAVKVGGPPDHPAAGTTPAKPKPPPE